MICSKKRIGKGDRNTNYAKKPPRQEVDKGKESKASRPIDRIAWPSLAYFKLVSLSESSLSILQRDEAVASAWEAHSPRVLGHSETSLLNGPSQPYNEPLAHARAYLLSLDASYTPAQRSVRGDI